MLNCINLLKDNPLSLNSATYNFSASENDDMLKKGRKLKYEVKNQKTETLD